MGRDLAIVAAVAAVEILLWVSWAPFYFRFGIPVFSRTFAFRDTGDVLIHPDELSQSFADKLGPSLLFHAIGVDAIAFREKLLEFSFVRYTPVMHGLIRFNEIAGTVTIRGQANVWPLCFAAVFVRWSVADGLNEFDWELLMVMAVVLIGCYVIQALRFNRVYRALKKRIGPRPGGRSS